MAKRYGKKEGNRKLGKETVSRQLGRKHADKKSEKEKNEL